MKKTILLVMATLLANTLCGVDETYDKKMGETIGQFSSCNTVEEFQNLANKFRIIANVEAGEWLPRYYEAQCYILMSFTETSLENKDAYLDQAESSLKEIMELAPREAEVYVLQAFYYTGRLVVNPPERAQTTSPLIAAAIGKALGLEPGNPRALFMKLSNELGTARYFGTDTTPYCKDAATLLEKWDSYALKSPIYPAWGKDQVLEIVTECGE